MAESRMVDRPLFVIGSGRSGLTPLMHLIAYHPDLAWPTQYTRRFPGRYRIAAAARLVELPPFNSRLRFSKYVPVHDEAYPFWTKLYFGFAAPVHDLTAADVTPHIRDRFHHAVGQMIRHQHKRRFVAEYSGWSRIAFLKAIFPDAQFIHVVRDGRAVANSLINVRWWDGWRGVHNWSWGTPSPEDMEKLEHYDHSFLALAALHWKIVVSNILEQSGPLGEHEVRLVRYEDMVRDPTGTAVECLEFAGLDPSSPRLLKHIESVPIVDANRFTRRIPSWRENMTAAQIEMLNDIIGDELIRFGYLERTPAAA
ncbi:MAG: sulfotransferase family protein [Gaiellales bacterium]